MQRDLAAEQTLEKNHGQAPTGATVSAASTVKPVLVQGVYVLHAEDGKQRVVFAPITTGVTGATDIEVTGGLKPGDTLVTGRYKILRILKSGTVVKPDNTVETTETTTS